MWRHRTDVVAFVFAIFFLVCAGLAVGVRTGNLGLGTSSPDGAWIAGTVLAVAGIIGVVGTLANLRRPGTVAEVIAPEVVEPEVIAPEVIEPEVIEPEVEADDVHTDDQPGDQS